MMPDDTGGRPPPPPKSTMGCPTPQGRYEASPWSHDMEFRTDPHSTADYQHRHPMAESAPPPPPTSLRSIHPGPPARPGPPVSTPSQQFPPPPRISGVPPAPTQISQQFPPPVPPSDNPWYKADAEPSSKADQKGNEDGKPRWLIEREGGYFCLLCHQWADEGHLGSKKHLKRAAEPEYYLWDEDEALLQGGASNSSSTALSPAQRTTAGAGAIGGAELCGTGKKCSFCKNLAVERDVDGSKTRYCGSCWEWWDREGQPAFAAGQRFNGQVKPAKTQAVMPSPADLPAISSYRPPSMPPVSPMAQQSPWASGGLAPALRPPGPPPGPPADRQQPQAPYSMQMGATGQSGPFGFALRPPRGPPGPPPSSEAQDAFVFV